MIVTGMTNPRKSTPAAAGPNDLDAAEATRFPPTTAGRFVNDHR